MENNYYNGAQFHMLNPLHIKIGSEKIVCPPGRTIIVTCFLQFAHILCSAVNFQAQNHVTVWWFIEE